MLTVKSIFLTLLVSLEGWAQTSATSTGVELRSERAEAPTTPPRDYNQWERRVTISEVRGGSYEASGVVKYYFKGTLYGVLDTAEEAGLSFDKRRKVALDLGTFGEIKIKSLDSIKVGEKSSAGMDVSLTGDQIRGLVAKSMLELGAKEGDVGVVFELQMLRRTKKYGILGQDTPVATTLIPWVGQGGPPPDGESSEIRLEDDQGAHAVLRIIAKGGKAAPA